MRIRPMFLPAAFVALAGQSSFAGLTLGDLRQYDLVVVNNLTSSSEVEGRTLVGGNITAGNTSNYGIKLNQAGYSSTPNNLIVGGSIQGPVNVNYGNVLVGGTVGNNVNGGNAISGVTVTANDSAVQGISSSIQSTLTSASTYLSSMAANSTYTPTSSFQNATVTFNATPNSSGVAVFDIAGSLLNGQALGVQQYVLNANGATSIIFNVTGGTAAAPIVVSGNFNGGGFGIGSIDQDVLWNFAQALGNTTTAGLQFDTGFNGSILAPNAYVTDTGSAINGAVFVDNLITQDEVHYTNGATTGDIYQGVFTPSSVPEPSAILTTLTGLAMAGGMAWRRRRRRAR